MERFNRTLKNKMWRYFDYANTHRYWNVLDDLVDGYNRTYHRSIKMTPLEVTKFNAQTVWKRLYPELLKRRKSDVKFKFKVGDLVRITRSKGVLKKVIWKIGQKKCSKLNAVLHVDHLCTH